MSDTPQSPGPVPPPKVFPRNYKVQAKFENHSGAEFVVQSLDHVGALAKITAAMAELVLQQPFRAVEIRITDISDRKIIVPPAGGRFGQG